MHQRKRTIAVLLAVFLLMVTVCCWGSQPLWERLEYLQYRSYAPGLRFLTKKYGDIFEMDEYGQITSVLPAYQGMSFEVEFDESTFQYEENFLIQYRRDEIESHLREKLAPVVGECKIYAEGMRSSLPKDAPLEDILAHQDHILKLNVCIPATDGYQSDADKVIEAFSRQGCLFSTLEILFFDAEQYERVQRDWVVPRLRGAGRMQGDCDYRFEHRAAVWFNFGTNEYVMNWR